MNCGLVIRDESFPLMNSFPLFLSILFRNEMSQTSSKQLENEGRCLWGFSFFESVSTFISASSVVIYFVMSKMLIL